MTEVEIEGNLYQVGRLNAQKQWHIMRRLMPVMAAGGPAIKAMIDRNRESENSSEFNIPPIDEIFSALGPLATALGELSDEASDYVTGTCLSVCMRKTTANTWAKLTTQNGHLLFEDLSMPAMLRLVLKVLQENLTDFLSALSGSLKNE